MSSVGKSTTVHYEGQPTFMPASRETASIPKTTRSSDGIAAFLVTALAVLIFLVVGMGWGDSSVRWVVLILIFYVIGWLLFRNSTHLVLVSIFLGATLPGVIYSTMLILPGVGGNLRLEYLLFVVLVGLVIIRRPSPGSRLPLDIPVAIFMFFQGISMLFALLRGDTQNIGVGAFIRLFEGYAFYYLASRLTRRDQIPSLVWTLTAIGGLVAIAIIVVTITGSQNLYINLISTSTNLQDVMFSKFYAQFFSGYQSPRIGYIQGEPLLLMTLILSVMMIFQAGWRQLWYSISAFLVALRMLVSGQRFHIAYMAATLLLALVLFPRQPEERKQRLRLGPLIVFALLAVGLYLLLSSGVFMTKWAVLVQRSANTLQYLSSPAQFRGIQLAWGELLKNPSIFGVGFGPFHSTITKLWDINLGFLVTLYYYGMGGMIALVVLLGTSVIQTLKLLRNQLAREERALVCAIIIFIAIYIASGFIRNMVFNELSMSVMVFSVCLGWVQVIWRDIRQANTKVGIER